MDKHKKTLHILLDIGETMLANGAEVKRVEDTLMRLGASYGASQMNVFVITSSIVVTMQFTDGHEETQTRRILQSVGTDFTKIEAFNNLSRECSDHALSLDDLQQKVREIDGATYPWYWLYLGSMLASGSFTVFFGGTFLDAFITAIFAVLICIFQKKVAPLCSNAVFFNLICSFVVGVGICIFTKLFPLLHLDMIMIGDIMLLIPGIGITNAVKDMLVGDTITGALRFTESLLWAGALACGFISAIWIMRG